MQITLTIQQSKVLEEVAATAEYIGDKMTNDDGAYERIRIVDANWDGLKRFWNECRAEVAKAFTNMVSSEGMYSYHDSTYTADPDGDYYRLTLDVSGLFDTAQEATMQTGLFSFFVQGITARWLAYTDKADAAGYAQTAAAQLEDVRGKVFYKVLPTRPYTS
jgi:hypothetical protein